MSIFVQPTAAPRQKTTYIRSIALAFAGILIVMAVAQLFSFEKFPSIIKNLGLPGGEAYASIRAAVIVTLEVFALPFLLSMRLSFAMRVFSMVAGWCVVVAWFITILYEITASSAANSGLLGATVAVPVGWWDILFCIILAIMAAWASWGMWPFVHESREI